jgi:hypothetical protein
MALSIDPMTPDKHILEPMSCQEAEQFLELLSLQQKILDLEQELREVKEEK